MWVGASKSVFVLVVINLSTSISWLDSQLFILQCDKVLTNKRQNTLGNKVQNILIVRIYFYVDNQFE